MNWVYINCTYIYQRAHPCSREKSLGGLGSLTHSKLKCKIKMTQIHKLNGIKPTFVWNEMMLRKTLLHITTLYVLPKRCMCICLLRLQYQLTDVIKILICWKIFAQFYKCTHSKAYTYLNNKFCCRLCGVVCSI